MNILKNPYFVSLITKINTIVLTFIGSVMLNRYLGPSLKGEYSFVLNYVNILSLILTLSITKAIPYFKKKYGDEIEKNIINMIYLFTLSYIAIAIVIASQINSSTIMIIMIFSIFSHFYQQISFVAMIKNINLKNILNFFDLFIYTLVLTSLFFFEFDDKLNMVFLLYSFKLVFSIIVYVITFKIYPTFKQGKANLGLYGEVLKFSFFPTISTLLITFNYKIDIIILENFESFSQIGLYSLGVTLAGMLWIVPDAFKDVLFNKTAKKDSIKDILFSIKFNIYISLIIILGFSLLGQTFILYVYGNEFVPATTVTLLLFIGNIPMIFFKMINTLYIAKGKQKLAMFILSFAVGLNVIVNFILIPLYGINGAAIASVLSYTLCGLLFLFSFLKQYNIKLKSVFFINKDEINYFLKLVRMK